MLAAGFWFRTDLKLFRVVSVENRVGYWFKRFERGIGSSGKVRTDFSLLLECVMVKVFLKVRFLLLQEGPETFKEGSETFSLMVPKPCPKVSKPWTKFSVRTGRFRNLDPSWTFGFDSGISRVINSSRFCNWTGSRGLHLLVSEPRLCDNQVLGHHTLSFGMARPRRGVRGGGQAPVHLDEVEIEQGDEETLPPPPPVVLEAQRLMDISCQAYLAYVMNSNMGDARRRDIGSFCDFPGLFPEELTGLPPDKEVEFTIEPQADSAPVSIAPYRMAPKELKT
ncbi:hypothetical protein GQ457_01G016830 [Hibiscus cannabinus]